MDIHEGDIITLKKKHPCGSFEWKVLRIGTDFRIECCGCAHQLMIKRSQVEKKIKNVSRQD